MVSERGCKLHELKASAKQSICSRISGPSDRKLILAEATEKGLTQRDCVISPGQREANVEAEEGNQRLM